jgi:dihydrofolate reductase
MRRVIVQAWTTVDGVAQAPGDPQEDTSGGFRHGGWSLPYFEEAAQKWVVDNLTAAGGLLLGRNTWEAFAGHWPNAPEEEQVLAEPMNTLPKYVATTTLSEPLAWQNSTVLRGDVAEAVAALKREDGGDLLGDRQHRAGPHAGRARAGRRVPGAGRPAAGGRRQAPVPRRRRAAAPAAGRQPGDGHGRDHRDLGSRRGRRMSFGC